MQAKGVGVEQVTLPGDTVNLAARIESHAKVIGCPILVYEETRVSLPESILIDT